MRRALPTGLAILCALILIVDFFAPAWPLAGLSDVLAEGAVILGAFALLFGAAHLLLLHGRRVVAEERGWPMGAILGVALLVTFALQAFWPASCASAWLFESVYYPLQATMMALLAFFSVTAAYRALRLKSPRAILFVLIFLFILLASAPFAGAIWRYLPALRDWIFAVPVMAGVRGILLGVALGTITAALRVLSGANRPYAEE